MKKIIKKIMPLTLVFAMLSTNIYAKDIIINGFTQYKDVQDIDGVLFMEHDILLDAMGVYYSFDINSQRLIISHDDTEIIITRGSSIATVNGEEVDMGVLPIPTNTQTFNNGFSVPIKFIAEQLNTLTENDTTMNIVTGSSISVSPNLYGVTSESIKYSYEEALKMAIANSSSIKNIENNMTTVSLNQEQVRDGMNAMATSYGMLGKPLDNDYVELLATRAMLTSTLALEEDMKEVAESGIEAGLISSIMNIETLKDNIKLLQENIDILETIYKNNTIKNELGLLSDSDLASSKKSLDDTKSNLAALELSLQTAKKSLNSILGVDLNEDNYIDFNADIEPLELEINSYATNVANNNLTVKNLKIEKDRAGYLYDNFLGDYSYDNIGEALRSAQDASRAVTDAINRIELSVHEYYTNLQQLENNHTILLADYQKAIEDYNKAILNYELGYITTLEVDYANLNVHNKFNAIRSNTFNYETLRFMLLNPNLIAK